MTTGENRATTITSDTTPIAITAKEADKTDVGNRCCTGQKVGRRRVLSAIICCGVLGLTGLEMDNG